MSDLDVLRFSVKQFSDDLLYLCLRTSWFVIFKIQVAPVKDA